MPVKTDFKERFMIIEISDSFSPQVSTEKDFRSANVAESEYI